MVGVFFRDFSVRLFGVFVTILYIFLSDKTSLIEFVSIVSVSSIVTVFLNFGNQFKEVDDDRFFYVRTFFLIASFLFFLFDFYKVYASGFFLGCSLAMVEEFKMRREKKFGYLFLISVIVSFPRLLSIVHDLNIISATVISGFLVFFVAAFKNKMPNKFDFSFLSAFASYAFWASVFYIVYQQLPPMLSLNNDVSHDVQQIEQVFAKFIFASSFVKSSLVLALIGLKVSIVDIKKAILFFSILLIFLVVDSSYKLQIIVCSLVYFLCEFAVIDRLALQHKLYKYKFIFFINFSLMLTANFMTYMGFSLVYAYSVASIFILFIVVFYEKYF